MKKTDKKSKSDTEHATAVRDAMDALCAALWDATKAGLNVEIGSRFECWYGGEKWTGPGISITRSL